jgi:(p)ppGpp synthase/HD superfamily hydrolase
MGDSSPGLEVQTGAPDLVERARGFATHAHRRIDHRRKYTRQPYEVHLKAVAELVASATDDAETIAAAQDIVSYDWPTIARLARRLADLAGTL